MKALSLLRFFFVLFLTGCLLATADAAARRREAAKKRAAPAAEATPEVKSSEKAPVAENAQVVILAYHRFVENVRRPDTEITVEEFREQMQALKDSGITPISMDDFLAWKRGEKAIPQRSALITFDDGWRTQITRAWPVLKEFGFPFTVFIYTDYVKGGRLAGGESMSWADLAELRDAGVGIESHTLSHSDLRGTRAQRESGGYEAWLKKELEESRQMLEQQLGIRVRALAVPYGYTNATVEAAAEKAGYEALFTVRGEAIDQATPNLSIGRYIMHHQKPKLFEMALRSVGGEAPAAVAEKRDIGIMPKPGGTAEDSKPLLKANLSSFGKFDPESLTIRLSGIGTLKGDYDQKSQTVTAQPENDLTPGSYTVIISATEGERRHEGRWEFKVAPEPKEQKMEEPMAGDAP